MYPAPSAFSLADSCALNMTYFMSTVKDPRLKEIPVGRTVLESLHCQLVSLTSIALPR